MKIVFAVHTYYPDENGVQVVTQYLAEGLAEKHDVVVISGYDEKDNVVQSEKRNNVQIERVKVRSLSNRYGFIGDKQRYRSLISQINPDVFICVCTQSWQFDWLKGFLNDFDCKKVLYSHGFSGLKEYSNINYNGISRLLRNVKHRLFWDMYYKKNLNMLKSFDAMIHLSASNESYAYALDNNYVHNYIIGNAVEDMFFDNPKFVSCEDDAMVPIRYIYVSNYGEIKNQELLLRAFYKTDKKIGSLCFVGREKNEYYHKLLRIKKELDCKYGEREVALLTGLSRVEIAEMLKNSDVFVASSMMEACSVVLLEAAAKGLPIITTDVGNARLIPGVVVVNDERELICTMEDMYSTPLLRAKCGMTLRCYAEQNASRKRKINQFEAMLLEIRGE